VILFIVVFSASSLIMNFGYHFVLALDFLLSHPVFLILVLSTGDQIPVIKFWSSSSDHQIVAVEIWPSNSDHRILTIVLWSSNSGHRTLAVGLKILGNEFLSSKSDPQILAE